MTQYAQGDTVVITESKGAGRLAGRTVRLISSHHGIWEIVVTGGAPGKGAPIGTQSHIEEAFLSDVSIEGYLMRAKLI